MVTPTTGYVPERGDVVWLNFNPQAGYEQAGHYRNSRSTDRVVVESNNVIGIGIYYPTRPVRSLSYPRKRS